MSNTILEDIVGVRDLLGHPLPQAPSTLEITEELRAEYQALTNRMNSVGDAWMVSEYSFATVSGTRRYQLTPTLKDFYKALRIVTVPASSNDPEYILEAVELEHLPKEWEWITGSHGQLFASSHDAQLIAFYRTIGIAGEELWCEIRPVPESVQSYKIIYQQGDWFGPRAQVIYSSDEPIATGIYFDDVSALQTGQKIWFTSGIGAGSRITSLVKYKDYFVSAGSDTGYLEVAASYQDAINDNPLVLTVDPLSSSFVYMTTSVPNAKSSVVPLFVPPHATQRYLVRAAVARNLLYRQRVRWSFDISLNAEFGKSVLLGIESRLVGLNKELEDYKRSLDNADIVYIEPWSYET